MAEPRLIEWLKSGGEFYCIGWAKRGGRGKKKVWTPSIRRFLWLEPNPKSMTQFEPYMQVDIVDEKLQYHSDICMCIDCIPTPKDPEEIG